MARYIVLFYSSFAAFFVANSFGKQFENTLHSLPLWLGSSLFPIQTFPIGTYCVRTAAAHTDQGHADSAALFGLC